MISWWQLATNTPSLQNPDRSALYFTQSVGIGGPVTTNMELEAIGNKSCACILLKIYQALMLVLIQYGQEI